MASKLVSLRLDENLKEEADELFSKLGLSFNAAINVFLRQAVREQQLPFTPSLITPPQGYTYNGEEITYEASLISDVERGHYNEKGRIR